MALEETLIIAIFCEAPRPYIAAVFDDEGGASRFLERIANNRKERMATQTYPDLSLPIYLLEDKRGFRFMGEAEATDDIRQLAAPQRDDEFVYTNLYRFDVPFIPEVPGRDEMGRLPHWHIENAHVRRIEAGGLSSL